MQPRYAANETIRGNTTLTNLPYDSHNVIVYTNDTEGNVGASERVYFTIDHVTPPNITEVHQVPLKDNVQPED